MGNYEQLKQAVSNVIKNNGNNEITGDILQNTLLSIISTVGGNATFAGIATPTTNPGTPDQNVFYIASQNGTYSNFGGVTLENQVVIFSNANGSWKITDTGIATEREVIYDVSARNNNAVFESLQALLSSSNLSTLIPISVRHGGMTIRFIQGSEQGSGNKYAQFRLMKNEWSIIVSDWQGVDDEPTVGSKNIVLSDGVANFNTRKIVEEQTVDITPSASNIKKGFFYPNTGLWKIDESTTSPNAAWITPNAISINHFKDIMQTESIYNIRFAFYDMNGDYISGADRFNINVPIEIPSNAKSVRFSYYISTTTFDRIFYVQSIEIPYIDADKIRYLKTIEGNSLVGQGDIHISDRFNYVKQDIPTNPLYGKHFSAIGDSHTNIATVWNKLAQIAGATYHHVSTELYNGETYITVDGTRTTVKTLMPNDPADTLWYNEVILALKTSNTQIDYIFYEDTHLGGLGIWEVDDSVKPIMITTQQKEVSTVFNTRQDALNYVANNISTIVSDLSILSVQAGFVIKYKTVTQVLNFKFTSGNTLNQDTTFSLYFGSDTAKKLTVNLTAGMTLEQCVYAMNDYNFAEYVDWRNANKGVHGYASITLTYIGSLTSNYPVAHIEVTEGSNLAFASTPTIDEQITGIPYIYYGTTIEGLNTASNWQTYGGNARWLKPNIIMGTIEYMKSNYPNAKFVGVGVPAYRSQNTTVTYDSNGNVTNDGALNPDGSINLRAIISSSTMFTNKRSTSCIVNLCNYYLFEFVDIFHNGEITPKNAYIDEQGERTPYYEWYNSHCTSEGYAAWARSIYNLLIG